eukprot:scaffold464811_cov24-Prasinocladus_malaysianus.AAC.1
MILVAASFGFNHPSTVIGGLEKGPLAFRPGASRLQASAATTNEAAGHRRWPIGRLERAPLPLVLEPLASKPPLQQQMKPPIPPDRRHGCEVCRAIG